MPEMTPDARRPRRSVLYMPGANERALTKAETLPADALILDLEDAVAPDAKAEARDRVCEAAASDRYGAREVTIRINGIGTPWHDDDLRAVAAADRARPVAARRPGHGQGDPRRRLQRHQERRGLRGRVRAGPPDGLRRQDAHPPQPARAVQPGVRPDRRRG